MKNQIVPANKKKKNKAPLDFFLSVLMEILGELIAVVL